MSNPARTPLGYVTRRTPTGELLERWLARGGPIGEAHKFTKSKMGKALSGNDKRKIWERAPDKRVKGKGEGMGPRTNKQKESALAYAWAKSLASKTGQQAS